jgi:TolB-like protein
VSRLPILAFGYLLRMVDMKTRLLLITLPILGLLIGFGLSFLWRTTPTPAQDPVIIAVIGKDEGSSADFFRNLQEALRQSPKVKVIDRRFMRELLQEKNDVKRLASARTMAQQFGAALMVSGTDNVGEKNVRTTRVELLEVNSGNLLWVKEWDNHPGNPSPDKADVTLAVKEILMRTR